MWEEVILVDEEDRALGAAEKLEAHRRGGLHRAFSVFVFDSAGNVLLQKRARDKYHSGGLWSNTCCSHPRPGEEVIDAARRRLSEEMGFTCDLREVFSFVYRAEVGNDLIEHEYDHVLVGTFDGRPAPDASEVEAWRWCPLEDLRKDLAADPESYTRWLTLAMTRVGTERLTGSGTNGAPFKHECAPH